MTNLTVIYKLTCLLKSSLQLPPCCVVANMRISDDDDRDDDETGRLFMK